MTRFDKEGKLIFYNITKFEIQYIRLLCGELISFEELPDENGIKIIDSEHFSGLRALIGTQITSINLAKTQRFITRTTVQTLPLA